MAKQKGSRRVRHSKKYWRQVDVTAEDEAQEKERERERLGCVLFGSVFGSNAALCRITDATPDSHLFSIDREGVSRPAASDEKEDEVKVEPVRRGPLDLSSLPAKYKKTLEPTSKVPSMKKCV